ncbi:RNA polymerase sigma factor sigB-like [Olea europaea var. sylvestris]|uniref:RNA polymerase sigma factor n=1 Tax=Olea europaea subsp. europaea TaxID=158383 RepID=A0A8S0Q3W9_OLEEU|nr:RNA polymerase sigma factor sigB-like [Olea europaea var. sylvestris]CAA2961002.1 RNA polymerase sigma factor sigB [Olea europaea subsp. europaea]
MSCLLPTFRCLPDTFLVNFKSQNHTATHPSKSRDPIYFQTKCILSTATATILELEKLQLPSLEAMSNSVPADRSWKPTGTTSVLEFEKLKLPSFDVHSNSIAANRPWTYIGADGPPTEANFQATLATETLLTSEEAVVVVVAAEALALAKAAVKVAKDAAKMVGNRTATSDCKTTEVDNSFMEKNQLAYFAERVDARESKVTEIGLGENDSASYLLKESDVEPSHEELELLEAQLSKSIAVRSKRQTERKAKRARAAQKAAANIVSVKSGSTSRKKRVLQDIDYSDPLRYLRGTTSSSRLLTAAEEQKFSSGIQDLLKLERLQEELRERYGDQLTFAQWAAAAGVDQKTLRERLNYGIICKDKMIKSNIRLVISIAKNYQGVGMNLQDLVQEGCRGLVRGAEKFDASKGFKFSTYAHWWIKQAVRKSLSDQSRTIRLPFHMVEATYRVKEARKQLFNENGRQPDDDEVAEATGLSMKRLSSVLLIPKAPRSLDQKIGINQDLKPSEVIADPEAETSEDVLMKEFMKQDLAKVLDTLNLREKQVIRWRFGLGDGRMKTLQEIGELMGVSRERIRQIESCAFRKLKNKRRTKHLQQYVMP